MKKKKKKKKKNKKKNKWNEGILESNASDLVPIDYELVLG